MKKVIFLKLGGSLITDKKGVEAVRQDVLPRLAREIQQAREKNPDTLLLLGHGSGSFGHVAGAKYGTRQGVESREQWLGFTEVSAAALRLNRIVVESLLTAGVPAMSFSPSASVRCENGRIIHIEVQPIQAALSAGLLPVTHGDVAFDEVKGGTIVSTEEVMMALALSLRPSWLLLAGETEGVYDQFGQVIPQITQQTYAEIESALGGSRGTDVTGGMASKVLGMLKLAEAQPGLSIRIFSGLKANELFHVLQNPAGAGGTTIRMA